jgi:C4-dicarboxylate-specific signal transduction histidine kinase
MPSPASVFRLQKVQTGRVLGPMDLDHLKALANQSLIAPDDLIQADEGAWQKAPEITELEMLWMVEPLDGPRYGPTTAGTIAEFLQSGQLGGSELVTHIRTRESFTVTEFLDEIRRRRDAKLKSRTIKLEEAAEPMTAAPTGSPAFDAALRLRIRQLETDLAQAKKLLEQQSAELARIRNAGSGLSI